MTPQGYPLWAIEADGTVYAVVGWVNYVPLLVSLGPVHTDGAGRPRDGQVFTFTTTDPRDATRARAMSEDRLRTAMRALADEAETEWAETVPAALVARRIRLVVNK